MDAVIVAAVAVAALVVGALLGWHFGTRPAASLKTERDAAAGEREEWRLKFNDAVVNLAAEAEKTKRLTEVEASLATERESAAALRAEVAAFRRGEAERERAHQEQLKQLSDLRAQLEAKFGELAGQALENAHTKFLKRADEKLGATGAETEQKLKVLLQPVEATLKRYEEGLKDFDQKREGSFGAIKEAVSQLLGENEKTRRETQRLANVMTASPKTRGRWGEEQLKNILESAGLRQGIDFFPQVSVVEDENRSQPDFIIKLPGNRSIIVDVKCPLVAFEQAFEEENEVNKSKLLLQHSKALRSYAGDLGKKGYWAKFAEAPDFVVMFVPGEHHLSAAAERDPKLIEDAFRNGVIVASTINMLALAKFMAGLWKQEALNRQAQEIAAHGRELHQRLATMAEHVLNLGTHLGRAAKSYNSMIGSLDRNVLTQAKRFEDLGAGGPKSIPELRPVDVQIEESVKLVVTPTVSNDDPPQIAAE